MALNLARPFETGAALGVGAGLYVLLLNDGGNTVIGGATLATLSSLVLGLLLVAPWMRRALVNAPGLKAAAWAFAVTVAVAVWTLTPWVPGGAHPAWSYVGGLGASTLDRASTFLEILKLLGAGCLFAAGYGLGRTDDRARLILNTFVAVGGAYALWSIVHLMGTRESGLERLSGSFKSANTAATFFGVLIAVTVSLAITAGRPRSSRPSLKDYAPAGPYWALMLLFGACLFLTASRGGAVAAAVGLLAFFGLEALAGRVHLKLGGGALVAAGALLLLQGPLLLSRVALHDSDGRQAMFGVYWRVFQDSPLFGYGLGTFDALNKMQLNAANYDALWSTRAAHNVYLQWLLEGGMIGALPMFAAVALVLWATWRGLGRRHRSTTLIRGLLAADAVVLVHGATDFALQVPGFMSLFAFLLGLQLGLANGSSQGR